MRTISRVSGMTCDGCARAVTQAIERAVPGARVKVDLEAGRVMVGGEGDAATVARAIAGAGFGFDGTI